MFTRRIQITAGAAESLTQARLADLEGVFSHQTGTVIQRSPSNEVRRFEIPCGTGQESIYVKKYWLTRLSQLRGRVFRGTLFGQCRAEREYHNLNQLCAWGFSLATPLAFGVERRWGFLWRWFLITRSVPEPKSLGEFIGRNIPRQPASSPSQLRLEIIQELAALIRRLHAKKFFHHDLFWRNVIVARNHPQELSIIDVPRGRTLRRPLTSWERALDLASLDGPAPRFFRRTERLRFLLLYLGQPRLDAAAKTLARLVLKTAEPMRPRQWEHMSQLLKKIRPKT